MQKLTIAAAALVLCAGAAGAGDGVAVSGEYAEARTCDVWTGPCFDNAVVAGDHAVAAWSVDRGAWNGVRLDGLRLVAVIDTEGQIQTRTEGGARSVVIVDRSATDAQAEALLSLGRTLAPKYLANVVRVERETISFERDGLVARVAAGSLMRLETTPLNPHCDKVCGNEERVYPTLSASTTTECAKTVENRFAGEGLNVRWTDRMTRSAFVGTFAR